MKKSLLALLCLIAVYEIAAQSASDKSKYFLWDKNWKSVQKAEEAAFLARLWKVDDTSWQWDMYNYVGPLIASQRFKDENIQLAHGRQIHYHPSGYIDSMGMAMNGRLEGEWYYFNDTGKSVTKKIFEKGRIVSIKDVDTISGADHDSTLNSDERESSFKGGIPGWQKFLKKNMVYPQRAVNAEIMGTVIVQFEVDATGKVLNAEIARSVEYSIDEEALRLIRKSPEWQPAWQAGKYVRSYKKQPMIFRFR